MVDKSEKFRWAVRLGYLSRAVLYALLGIIALTQRDQVREGAQGVFQAIENFPAGTVLLWLVALGLLAYALFRLASPLFDIENEGSDNTGIAKRVGHLGSAIGHFALAYSAYVFATSGGGGSDGDTAQQAAAGVLSVEFGDILIGLVGLAFIVAGLFQAKKGFTGEFMQRISARAPDATRALGGAGYAARAVVFVIIGWSLMQSAWFSSSSQVVTLGGAIASLSDDGIWFTLVAIGLVIFGLFSLILARYRIIPDMAMGGKVPAFRA